MKELTDFGYVDTGKSCKNCREKGCLFYPDWGFGAVLRANTCPHWRAGN